MTLFKAIFLATIVIVAGCRKDVRSRSKSIVGLEADLDPTILKGEAPSFLQLQKWFQGELPVSSEKAQVGHINYQVHSDFSESTVSNLPQEYRDKIIAYLVQQGQRVADFQSNLKNPQKLNALLKSEADEMEDILTALVVVGYKPRTNDLLAHLVAHPPLRNFVDRYSVELLEQLYKRSQRSLIAGLPKEAENFANLMSKTYIGPNGANDKFISGLKNNCAKIQNMLASLKVSKSVPCNGAEGMNLTTTPVSLTETAKSIGGPSGRVLGIFGGIAGRNGFAAAQGVKPQLQIFGGKDPTSGDPYANGGGGTTGGSLGGTTGGYNNTTGGYNNTTGGYNNTTGGMGGQSLLSSLAKLFSGMDDYEAEDDSDWMALTAKSNTRVALPPKPKGICGGKSGMALVICQRNIETLPPVREVFGEHRATKINQASTGSGFNLTGGHSFYLIANYGTTVQNQGAEGACTAFGNAHTIGAIAKAKGKSGEYDAWKIWQAQGQQMYSETSLEAAKKMDFDGLRITSVRTIDPSINAFKRLIDSGKAVYTGTSVDGSWHENSGNLTCNGGKGGHAFSIQGYDDEKRLFIVKNSWGDSWGDQGYGYINYDCVENQYWHVAYDITLQ